MGTLSSTEAMAQSVKVQVASRCPYYRRPSQTRSRAICCVQGGQALADRDDVLRAVKGAGFPAWTRQKQLCVWGEEREWG